VACTQELKLLYDYLYQINTAAVSGEMCLNALLRCCARSDELRGVYARRPLSHEVKVPCSLCSLYFHLCRRSTSTHKGEPNNANSFVSQPLEKLTMPTTVLFGDQDWMFNLSVNAVVKKIPGCTRGVEFIDNSGHQIHIENAYAFNRAVARALR
jgi:pimeloyl-ACP methyl ester carboxylesterase